MTYTKDNLPVGTRFLKDDMQVYTIREWSPSGNNVKVSPESMLADIWLVASDELFDSIIEILKTK